MAHRIDTANATSANLFQGSSQTEGQAATTFDPDWCNDMQENVCQAIEDGGIDLVKNDYTQLSTLIQSVAGKKRNLNFNPAFMQTQSWGGSSAPSSSAPKMVPVGWYMTGGTLSASDLSVVPSTSGLHFTGTASGSGQTIICYQGYSRTYDAVYGNDTFSSAGETKKFTSSVKYKKNSGSDFTIVSYISSTTSFENIIKDVQGDTTDATTGTAYRQISVNTQDMTTYPVASVAFKITLSASGAFDFYIKNCDLTEGYTSPDFQTYGDYIADKAFADKITQQYAQSGSFDSIVGAWYLSQAADTSYVYKVKVTIPLHRESGSSSGDAVTLSNIGAVFNDSDGGSAGDYTDIEQTITINATNFVVEFTINSPLSLSAQPYSVVDLSFDWTFVSGVS